MSLPPSPSPPPLPPSPADSASAARLPGAPAEAAGADPVGSAAMGGASGQARQPRPRTGWRLSLANLGLGLALLLAAVALVVAWNVRERHAAFERELVLRQQDGAALAAEARLLAKQAQEGMLEGAAKVALLEARLAEVTVQRGQLEVLLQSLSRSRDENLIVDIEAEIRVAVQHNAITGSAEPLLAALKQSDERLQRHAEPKFERVRRAIARDLDRVRAAGVADVASLAIKLDEAIRMVDELPLLVSLDSRKAGPTPAEAARAAASAASAPASAPGAKPRGAWPGASALAGAWDAAWQRIAFEARSLIRVTRIDAPEAMLIAPEQAFFLKENLKLRLLNARLALLSRQFETAQSDLAGARSMLEKFFDRNSKRTQLAMELAKQVGVQARQVVVPRPDETLAALAAAGAGR
jgi:uroporphyrin-III C-methyltransferase